MREGLSEDDAGVYRAKETDWNRGGEGHREGERKAREGG